MCQILRSANTLGLPLGHPRVARARPLSRPCVAFHRMSCRPSVRHWCATPRCETCADHPPPPHGGWAMKRLIALGCVLLLAACNSERPSAPLPDGVQASRSGGGGSFAFVNFALGAAPGTVCPGAAGCTNGAAEPMIRADAAGTFYVSSELGVGSGTLA